MLHCQGRARQSTQDGKRKHHGVSFLLHEENHVVRVVMVGHNSHDSGGLVCGKQFVLVNITTHAHIRLVQKAPWPLAHLEGGSGSAVIAVGGDAVPWAADNAHVCLTEHLLGDEHVCHVEGHTLLNKDVGERFLEEDHPCLLIRLLVPCTLDVSLKSLLQPELAHWSQT